jgi:hypothetical protein
VVNNSPNLVALNSNASFQWLDCSNGYSPLINDTLASFNPAQNGNYAVLVEQNGCIDTSSCFSVINVGIKEASLNNTISIYPNPASNLLYIESIKEIEKLQTFSMDGKLVKELEYKSNSLDVSFLDNGIYFLKLQIGSITQMKKFVVAN